MLSVHDEWVLAIISLSGILLSGTGHLHPERDSEHLEDLIVRFQPYLQRSNFTAKEEFGDSERASSTVPPVYRVDFLCFLVFFVRSESYFLQYSSEKSQSWQECGQVTPHHNCIVKIY